MGSKNDAGIDEKLIVLVANTSWYLWNFRRCLAIAIRECGFDVVFFAPEDEYSDRLCEIGRFVPIAIDRKGKNPFKELLSIAEIAMALRRERPHVILTWTPKANIYCGLISRVSGVDVIPNVAGLGSLFVNKGLLSQLVGLLYKVAFGRSSTVFFQNRDDLGEFITANWVSEGSTKVLPGSGVDLDRFTATSLPQNSQFVFLFGGRLIADKGLPELVEACRRLRTDGFAFVLLVYGHFDPGNPSSISEKQIAEWTAEGLVDYRGPSDQMELAIQQSDCVVLPSYYREGIPRILLEAAASARPVITTNSTGCREAVDHEVTGFMCEPRDVKSLAAAMKRMMTLSVADRERMGWLARQRAEAKFSEEFVVSEYLDAIRRLSQR